VYVGADQSIVAVAAVALVARTAIPLLFVIIIAIVLYYYYDDHHIPIANIIWYQCMLYSVWSSHYSHTSVTLAKAVFDSKTQQQPPTHLLLLLLLRWFESLNSGNTPTTPFVHSLAIIITITKPLVNSKYSPIVV
jgi:hypothetical protein